MKLKIVSILVLFTFMHSTSWGKVNWPDKEWKKSTLSDVKIDKNKFEKFKEYVFDNNAKFETDGIVLIKNGSLVFEHYAHGYNANMKHLLWSATKSVSNALVGIAVKQGRIGLTSNASDYYKNLQSGKGKGITVKHLLNMSSGLNWTETYESNPFISDVIEMLYVDGHKDMALYTSKIKAKFKPDTNFRYSSGETNLLLGILKKSLGTERFEKYPWVELFDPIGISSAVWERDEAKTFVGSSYLYLTPQDMARFGLLYLREGKWKDQQILNPSWIKFSKTLAPTFSKTDLDEDDQNQTHGAHFWLNLPVKSKNLKRPFPDAPEDLYYASGHHGQMITIIPSLDLILVRTAFDKDEDIDKNKMFKLLIESVEK
jgi:CubicO group peptidase (beta-lactamase class C family)